MDVPGWGHAPHRGAGRRAGRHRPRRARARAVRPRRRAARRCCTAARGPRRATLPEWLVPLGPHHRLAVQRRRVEPRAARPSAVSTLRRELRAGGFDVVHIHEPVAPVVGWDALTQRRRRRWSARSTATPSRPLAHGIADARWAPGASSTACTCGSRSPRPRRGPAGASTAAATGSSPTASTLPTGGARRAARRARLGEPLRIAFVGQAVERKGLPVLLRAFEALRDQVPAELTVVGADRRRRSRRCWSTSDGVTALGRVDDADEGAPSCARADVLCAPSLGGESFGMVLTEAFAAGTPVVASDIAGYRDVVARRRRRPARPARRRDARWPRRCATSRSTPRASQRLAAQARPRAPSATPGRTWPSEVVERLRGRASPCPAPVTTPCAAPAVRDRRAARRRLQPRIPARRLPSLEPGAAPARRARASARRAAPRWSAPPLAVGGSLLAAAAASACSRDRRRAACAPSPAWVLVGLALMCASMLLRAVSWHAILQGGAARRAAAHRRRHAGHDDRRADVGHAARAPGRALARADRRAPPGPRARPLARRARHDRLADAAQRARAGDPRRA